MSVAPTEVTFANPDKEPPLRIGPFVVVKELRRGGMATLYLAKRFGARGFARPVVIKVMRPVESEDERLRQMFVDEALLGSHMQHPNIVQMEEFGEEDGANYLVMEYVEGCSVLDLGRHLRRQGESLDVTLAVAIVVQVCRALDYAHGLKDISGDSIGVVHRDISPGNILVSRSGNVKLIDFGIAQSDFRADRTVQGIKGKFRYMSPEQAAGGTLDRRTDIYSLALILWELLSGQRAIAGESHLAVLSRAKDPEIPTLSEVAQVSQGLSDVVHKALALHRADRYSSAGAFAGALLEEHPSVLEVNAGEIGHVVSQVPSGPSRVSLVSSGTHSFHDSWDPTSETRHPEEESQDEPSVSGVVVKRRRRNRVGLLLVLAGFAIVLGFVAQAFSPAQLEEFSGPNASIAPEGAGATSPQSEPANPVPVPDVVDFVEPEQEQSTQRTLEVVPAPPPASARRIPRRSARRIERERLPRMVEPREAQASPPSTPTQSDSEPAPRRTPEDSNSVVRVQAGNTLLAE